MVNRKTLTDEKISLPRKVSLKMNIFTKIPAVDLPDFALDESKLWFAMSEARFSVAGIMDKDTKLSLVVDALDAESRSKVLDIIVNNSEEDKYEKVKGRLIEIADKINLERLIMKNFDVGDRKPSQLLRYMRFLGGSSVPDNMMKVMWMGYLPKEMRMILCIVDGDLEKVAERADAVHEAMTGYK